MTVPSTPFNWVPSSVPAVEGVALTLRLAVVCTRSFKENLVLGGGVGGGVTAPVDYVPNKRGAEVDPPS